MASGSESVIRSEEVQAMNLGLSTTETSDLIFVFGKITDTVRAGIERSFGAPCADSDLNPSVLHAASELLQQWLNFCRDKQIDPVSVMVVLLSGQEFHRAHRFSIGGVFERLNRGLAAYDALEQAKGLPLPSGERRLDGGRTVRRVKEQKHKEPMDEACVLLLKFVAYCHRHCLNVSAAFGALFGTLMIRLDEQHHHARLENSLYWDIIQHLRDQRS